MFERVIVKCDKKSFITLGPGYRLLNNSLILGFFFQNTFHSATFSKLTFSHISFRNLPGVKSDVLISLICVPTICKGYQQMTLAGKR